MAEKVKYFKRHCKYTEAKIDFIDYKDVKLLKHSMSERSKLMPRRLTGNTKKAQDMINVAVKRARHMALVPYVVSRRQTGV
ncbi:MAG: 30S ribosomal protein S18 [Campylobacterales bacterium]|nr:30S ribosomal protein S18 [Campylobacterales bacterium]